MNNTPTGERLRDSRKERERTRNRRENTGNNKRRKIN